MDNLENMKVADIKNLALLYGIDKNDIKGSGINGRVLGTDYIKAIKKYDKQKAKKCVTPNKKNVSPDKKCNVPNKKCGAPDMININDYTKCENNKICNIGTGRCIANTNVNKKNKSVLTIDDRIFVDDEKVINNLRNTFDNKYIEPKIELDKKDIRDAFIKCITK